MKTELNIKISFR